MYSGEVTFDSLQDVFRSLSYKRRNGYLSVNFNNRSLVMALKEGRIVDVQEPKARAATELCKRLVAAGCLVEKVIALVDDAGISVAQLQDLLISKNYVSQEDFERAKRGYELDLLYSIRTLTEGAINFAPKIVRKDPRHSFEIYPCQLLLDFAEFNGDEERFDALFEGMDSEEVQLEKTSEQDYGLTDSERIVLDTVTSGASPRDVLQRSLLCAYDAMEALLALYDQQLISVTAAEDETQSLMEEALEEAHAEEAEAPVNGHAGDDSEVSQTIGELVEQAAGQLKEISAEAAINDDELHQIDMAQQRDVKKLETNDDALNVFSPEASGEQSESAAEDVPPAHAADQGVAGADEAVVNAVEQAPYQELGGMQDRLKSMNYHLLAPDTARMVVYWITIVFLLVLGLIGADLFDHWFKVMAEFTSK